MRERQRGDLQLNTVFKTVSYILGLCALYKKSIHSESDK